MNRLYGPVHRSLQDRFDTRRLAENVEAPVVLTEIPREHKARRDAGRAGSREGQSTPKHSTPLFAVAMLGGAALNFAPINPIKALFWSAVINGVVAVPVMAVMMLMGRNRKIMGEFVLGGWLLTVGWLAIAVIWPQRS
jgi:hypothetical protein